MTIVFYIVAALLVLVCALYLMLSVKRKPALQRVVEHKQANLAILREQLKEIERDKQAGVLSAQDFEQAQMDLRQRVLEENEGLKTESVQQAGAPKLAWTLMVSIPVAAIALYFYLGNPVMLDPAAVQQQANAQPVDIEAMVARLEQRLKEKPDDPGAWLMMARSHRYYGRHQEAAEAYAKAMPVVDGDPTALAEYAESMLLAGVDTLDGLPGRLVKRSLDLYPEEPLGLMLAGAAALHKEQYPEAIDYWQRLLAQFPADSETAKVVNQGLQLARERMRMPANSAPEPAAAP